MRTITRLALLVLIGIGAFSYQERALATCQGVTSQLTTLGYESITVSSASIGFTAATVAPAGGPAVIYAYVTTETNPIRFRADGPAPTASEGHLVPASSAFEVCGTTAVKNLRMIRTGSDATVKATYYVAQ
jgi:hypothetical protein